jgi:adenosylmethionine-8-amino-7-oxononanoate aminotransferase
MTPDILCTSKGLTGGALPMAATLATAPIFESHRSADRSQMLFHSTSFTGNPMTCAAALANVAVWETEPVQDRIATLSRWQADNIARFADDPHFVDPRCTGTIAAVDLRVPDAGYLSDIGLALRQFFMDRNIWMRPLGNTIYVMPPYCITRPELDSIHDAIAEAGARFAS